MSSLLPIIASLVGLLAMQTGGYDLNHPGFSGDRFS
jgi:hypothetical protein